MCNAEAFAKKIEPSKAALILDEVSRYYLSGFQSTDGVLYVLSDKAYLFLDSRYTEMAYAAKKRGEISDFITIREDRPFEAIHIINRQEKVSTILFEDERLSCARLKCLKNEFSKVRFSSVGDRIDRMRYTKSPAEVEKIRSAQKITDQAFLHILDFIDKTRTELDVAAELEYFMRKNGADGLAFETIAVSGVKSSMPHGRPENILLTENSFITMDFGARFEGYCSDMTRTVVLGRADEEMKRVYETVLEAQKCCLDYIRGGRIGAEVDKVARDYINENGYGTCFGHSLGHSLGIEIHEEPRFAASYNEIIPSGAVLSVEPGIYINGKYGVRIEDIVLVTDKGLENLTHSDKKLIEL